MIEIDKLQDRIIEELDSLIKHLDKFEEKYWSEFFRKIKKLIDNGDTRAIDSLTNIRGGMGSFTDLVICQLNGHTIEKKEEDFANTELQRLGNIVLKSADSLKHLLNKHVK